MENFVITQDQDTADQLVAIGLKLIQSVGNTFVFLNNPKKMQFAKDADLKFAYTNKMMF